MRVLENKALGEDLFLLRLDGESTVVPGQFFMLRPNDRSRLLGRPLSVFSAIGGLSFLIKAVGEGTEGFRRLRPGDSIDVEGPYGNGFPPLEAPTLFIGGGTGIAPSFHLLESDAKKHLRVAIGLRAPNPALEALYAPYGDRVRFYIGDDIFRDLTVGDETIYTCGPAGMMQRAVEEAKGDVYVSLESRMGCGFGACLACTCKVKEHRERVCVEGPVFEGRSVCWK